MEREKARLDSLAISQSILQKTIDSSLAISSNRNTSNEVKLGKFDSKDGSSSMDLIFGSMTLDNTYKPTSPSKKEKKSSETTIPSTVPFLTKSISSPPIMDNSSSSLTNVLNQPFSSFTAGPPGLSPMLPTHEVVKTTEKESVATPSTLPSSTSSLPSNVYPNYGYNPYAPYAPLPPSVGGTPGMDMYGGMHMGDPNLLAQQYYQRMMGGVVGPPAPSPSTFNSSSKPLSSSLDDEKERLLREQGGGSKPYANSYMPPQNYPPPQYNPYNQYNPYAYQVPYNPRDGKFNNSLSFFSHNSFSFISSFFFNSFFKKLDMEAMDQEEDMM